MRRTDAFEVLQLGPWPPPHGGVQTHLVAIHRYLDQHGIRNAVVNLTRHRGQDGEGVFYPRTAWETATLLRRLPTGYCTCTSAGI